MIKTRIANPFVRGLVEWILAIGLAVILFFVLRMFLFRVAHVSGFSMAPTLSDGDRVILNRAAVVFGTARVGDIVAFPYPNNPSEYYIKRVIGISGDEVDLINGSFYVNGEPLEDAFSHDTIWSTGNVIFPVTVEEGHVFVLGDNRNASSDSRSSSIGMVDNRYILGRVLLRVLPFNKFGTV